MLLPIHTSKFLNRSSQPPNHQAPVGAGDCVGAAVLFVMAMALALILLGIDWPSILAEGERPLPEASRMMVINPLPR